MSYVSYGIQAPWVRSDCDVDAGKNILKLGPTHHIISTEKRCIQISNELGPSVRSMNYWISCYSPESCGSTMSSKEWDFLEFHSNNNLLVIGPSLWIILSATIVAQWQRLNCIFSSNIDEENELRTWSHETFEQFILLKHVWSILLAMKLFYFIHLCRFEYHGRFINKYSFNSFGL